MTTHLVIGGTIPRDREVAQKDEAGRSRRTSLSCRRYAESSSERINKTVTATRRVV